MSTTKPVFTALSSDGYAKLIGKIGKNQAALKKLVLEAAINAVFHSIKHHNADPAIRLANAITNASRKDAVVAFLQLWGDLDWNKATKAVVYKDRAREFDFDGMIGEDVFATVKAPEPKSIDDFDTVITKMLDRLQKEMLAFPDARNKARAEALIKANAEFSMRKLFPSDVATGVVESSAAALTEHTGLTVAFVKQGDHAHAGA